ncbi:hypothetical protein [Micromonospora polyrhachis]
MIGHCRVRSGDRLLRGRVDPEGGYVELVGGDAVLPVPVYGRHPRLARRRRSYLVGIALR